MEYLHGKVPSAWSGRKISMESFWPSVSVVGTPLNIFATSEYRSMAYNFLNSSENPNNSTSDTGHAQRMYHYIELHVSKLSSPTNCAKNKSQGKLLFYNQFSSIMQLK